MVIIHQFEKNSREDGLIYVTSKEVHSCPRCGGKLKVKDYRKRQGWSKYGDKHQYLLRRLRCKKCGAVHIELPHTLLPYKRYDTEAVESVLNSEDSDCVVSIRTKVRWKRWYSRIWLPILQLLYALTHRKQSLMHLETMEKEKPKEAGWLKTAVMAVINSGEKVPT